MSGPVETKSFALSWDLPHTAAKVWRALTEPQLLSQWLMENDMRPAVGHGFTFRQPPQPWWDGIVHCEVLEVVSERRIRYAWRGDRIGSDAYRLDTVVTWTLTAIPSGGTRVGLEQSGFTADTGAAFQNAQKGWEGYVASLRALLPRIAS